MALVSIASLVASCTDISGKVAGAITNLLGLASRLQHTESHAKKVIQNLKMFQEVADELEMWLKKEGEISRRLRETIQSSLTSCVEIVNEIEDVIQISDRNSDGRSIPGAYQFIWEEPVVQEFDRMLGAQALIFTSLLHLVKLDNEADQNARLDNSQHLQGTLARGNKDAETISASRRARPLLGGDGDTVSSHRLEEDSEIVPNRPPVGNNPRAMPQIRLRRGSQPTSSRSSESSMRLQSTKGKKQASHPFALVRLLTPASSRSGSIAPADPATLFSILCAACRDGDIDLARDTVGEGANVNGRDGKRLTPLYHAVKRGAKDIVELLVHQGALLDGSDGTESSVVFEAVRQNQMEILEFLLQYDPYVNGLVTDSADLSIKRTPLGLAVENGLLRAVTLLLEHGADVDLKDWSGLTPLCAAVNKQRSEIISCLIESNAEINDAQSKASWGTCLTALHVAAYNGLADIGEVLLDSGADILAPCVFTHQGKRYEGVTPIHIAQGACLAKLLDRYPRGKNTRDGMNAFPLSWAARRGDLEAVRVLLPRKVSINIGDKKTPTALQVACQAFFKDAMQDTIDEAHLEDYVQVVEELVRAGAKEGGARLIVVEGCEKLTKLAKRDGKTSHAKTKNMSLPELMRHAAGLAKVRTDNMKHYGDVKNVPTGRLGAWRAESFLAQVVMR